VIDRFRKELEAVGGQFFRGRDVVADLEGSDVSVTPTLAAIADTGTVVLSSRLNGGRRAGLWDPVHVALVAPDDLLADLPSALARIRPELDRASVVTLVTGPSRTADIEGTLIRGAHGPRELHVVWLG
jgi:L-lactate dehydrogenase complex protein LldG